MARDIRGGMYNIGTRLRQAARDGTVFLEFLGKAVEGLETIGNAFCSIFAPQSTSDGSRPDTADIREPRGLGSGSGAEGSNSRSESRDVPSGVAKPKNSGQNRNVPGSGKRGGKR